MPVFIHLRARTAYSLLEGALTVKKLTKLAAKLGTPALGVTDTNNLFGALETSEALAKEGIQPIIGVTLKVKFPASKTRSESKGPIALLAQNEVGYQNLMALSTAAYFAADDAGEVILDFDRVAERSEGLILLTGGPDGALSKFAADGQSIPARSIIDLIRSAFPDRTYIELQRHGLAHEIRAEEILLDLAYKLKLPIVATNEPLFEKQDDYDAHDALLCIADGAYLGVKDRRRVTPQHYFKTSEEMTALFNDLPEAIENTVQIAKRCSYRPKTRAPILPSFSGAEGRDEPAELKAQAEAGLRDRLAAEGFKRSEPENVYWERLEREIGVITKMGFPGYFLIVADFIKWAKSHGIPVGPGRGSGAGSLVAWALTVTDLDPLRFGLLFERFLNPERISMPDFDIDFCQDRRGEVISYVRDKYGADRVAQIITFGTLQPRAALRDVGRVMQMSFGQVDRICKLVPNNPADPVSLSEAIEVEPKLQQAAAEDADVRALFDTALRLEGLYRNASTHAAGVVISDRPLQELVPLYRDSRSDMPATQFNMGWVEPAGLVKFDFLGLKTLTVIKKAVDFVRRKNPDFDIDRIPQDDAKTFSLMSSGATLGVFQLEGQGMRDTLRRMRPDSLEDVIALISLYRPGPMKNIPLYCDVKFEREDPDYLHPKLEGILKETYGVIIYQEQVMQIAQILSGYSLGEADLLRRAMGKKKPEEMAKQKDRFMSGAVERGVEAETADRIFELVSEFAGYGFNKSHAAAYAVISYQTGYLKAHYPVEFIAASMSLDAHNTDKLSAFRQEALRFDLKVIPPHVNESSADFEVRDGAILYALGALKNVGLTAMEALVAERETNGRFKDLNDLARRVDHRVINKRALEGLAKTGALDCLEPNRARAMANVDLLIAEAQKAAQERESAQENLFGGSSQVSTGIALRDANPWSEQQRLSFELEGSGLFLSGHPMDDLVDVLAERRAIFYADAVEMAAGEQAVCRLAGVVRARVERVFSHGRMGFVMISDPTGEYEVAVLPETLVVARPLLEVGSMLTFKARLRHKDGELRITAEGFEVLDPNKGPSAKGVKVSVREGVPLQSLAKAVGSACAASQAPKGALRLLLTLADGREVEIEAPAAIPVEPAARAVLKAAKGVEDVAWL
jgi:DNA polymerase III subunit alpha